MKVTGKITAKKIEVDKKYKWWYVMSKVNNEVRCGQTRNELRKR